MKKITLLVITLLLALSVHLGSTYAQGNQTLTVFAASSLTDAFKEIATAFKAANPGADVIFNFGSSSTLATQLGNGAPADLFASANAKQMDTARAAGRISDPVRTFAKNRLVLAVPVDNPAKIANLHDLAKAGVKLVIAAPNVPVRDYTNAMLDKLSAAPNYGPDYKASVLKNVVSEEDNVRQVSAKIALGEADAGLVYRSDITPEIASKVTILQIPDAYNTLATYPIAVTNNATNATLAQKFMTYVLSDAGQDTVVKWNFISVRIPALPATITLPTDGALHIDGQVLFPLTLTADDLKSSYASQTVSVTFASGDQTVTASFTGVLLSDLLDVAGVNVDTDVKNDKLRMYLVATGSDGDQVLVNFAEIDPDYGNQKVLVAYEQDAKPITDKPGPLRLVIPGDKRGGRYVQGLVNLNIRSAPTVGK